MEDLVLEILIDPLYCIPYITAFLYGEISVRVRVWMLKRENE
jgi:hypothetical protein